MLTVNILFGMNYAFSKEILTVNITAVGLNELRFLAACVVFWLISLSKKERVGKKDMLILFIGSLFGLLGNQIFFIQGLSRTSPLDSSIIATSVPIITMVLSAIFLKEPASWVKIFGVVVGASGAVFLVYSSQADASGQSSLTGNLLCLASCLSYATFLIVTKRVSQRYSPITIMKWMFLFAVLLYTPFSLKDVITTNYAGFTNQAVFSLLFAMIGATVFPYLLLPVGQSRLRPTTLAMYNYIQPIVAAVLAAIMGQDTYTLTKAFAALLVFLGVYIVTRSKSRADIDAEKAGLPFPVKERED